MGRVVGIDLGTTNSAVAVVDSNGKPVIVPNSEGKPITPSVICFRDTNDIVVGDEAKELQGLGMYPIAAFFKREMGDDSFFLEFHGKKYSATDLSTILLKKLKKDAEENLGETITDVVITVPAYFREKQRVATIEAGKAAGFNVLQVINEPTAAAIAYGFDGKQQVGKKILIYDLGGGTFDITLAEITSDGVRAITSNGNHELGGKDWDDRIITFLATRFQGEYGDDPLDDGESKADLQVQAEEAKRKLTNLQSAKVSIVHDGNRGQYEITRDKFNEITADLMHLTTSLTKRVLDETRLDKNKIDGILLVGGSTRMPMVHDFIKSEFGKPPLTGVNVDEAVALGAAVVATQTMAEKSGSKGKSKFFLAGKSKVVDVTNHSLGMVMVNSEGNAYINSIILPKNTVIPCTESKPGKQKTKAKKENISEIFLTQGEGNSPQKVNYLGLYVVHDIPHTSGETIIDISYKYDESGTVHVSAKAKGSNKTLPVTIEELPDDVPERFLHPPKTVKDNVKLNIFITIDISGSMSGKPLKDTKRAAKGFVNKFDLNYVSFALMVFSDDCYLKLNLSNDKRAIDTAIESIDVGETGYGTSANPFSDLYNLITSRNNKLKNVDEKNIIVTLTDGCWCYQEEAILTAKRCIEEEIESVAIGFGGADEEFLKKISSRDDLNIFVTDSSQLTTAFSTIAQSMKE